MATVEGKNNNNKIPTNAELVERRLKIQREKQEARLRSHRRVTERNFQVKELLQDKKNGGANSHAALYQVKVTVDEDLRKELKLSGREKRGRVFLEKNREAVQSLHSLKLQLHAFFRALRKDTFLLKAGYPQIDADGAIISSASEETIKTDFWEIGSDEDVIKTFQAADRFFEQHESQLKRPSIVIHVQRNPNAPAKPPPPAYLKDMKDPKATTHMTMLSFYSFPPSGIEDPDKFAAMIKKLWKPFGALGRVYVAKEGVNAQMSIPTNILGNFMECCQSIAELGQYMENGINIDPKPLTIEEFATAGTPAEGRDPAPPFKNLHIRVRGQVVADGLDHALDWQSAGYDMPPLEWHEALKKARESDAEDTKPVILDCRNTYETDVGIFEGAEPLGTENFRESWDVLKDRLADTPKDTPIMTYCTGGIRCVKVGAYLTQELGFRNVSRLAGGIIAYDRTLNEEAGTEEPMFKGTNFVFDGRLGRTITDDALGTCITCGAETSLVSNCRNSNCHKRMIQCQSCRTSFQGTCSDACKHRLVHGSRRFSPAENAVAFEAAGVERHSFETLDEYSSGHSTPPPSLYREMEFNTQTLIPSGSHMVSGNDQGRLLKQLSSMTRNGRVLELGTFTGYATACLLEGACDVASTQQQGAYVMTMERDRKAFNVAASQLKAIADNGFTEAAAEALCALRSGVPDVLEDNVCLSMSYDPSVQCDLVLVSDALATVEEMAVGEGKYAPTDPFDLVFVDADKTRLVEYADACLSSDLLLRRGGLIVVDNVLWKGLVIEASNANSARDQQESYSSSDEKEEQELDPSELKRNRRARKLANKMHSFNSAIAKDSRAEVLVLPLRDGLSIIRKK